MLVVGKAPFVCEAVLEFVSRLGRISDPIIPMLGPE